MLIIIVIYQITKKNTSHKHKQVARRARQLRQPANHKKDENKRPSEIAITVVIVYNNNVLIPNLDIETSSDKDTIPHTIEKNIRGTIISFSDDKKR